VKLGKFVDCWVKTLEEKKPVVVMLGAHVLKVGLGPLLIQGMQQGWISALAMNGAVAVHDFELGYQGATSEDVARGLEDGTFGMVRETGQALNQAAKNAADKNTGFGRAVAQLMEDLEGCQYPQESILVQAARLDVPATVHVAIGTDIVHQHPSADGAAIGAATYRDFQLLVGTLVDMKGGGLVINFGSAVIMPEIFLKALTVARNLNDGIEGFSTANFDMIAQYRPRVNVVERPTSGRGEGYQFTGHHELMIPLVFQALAERLGV
jgi:hypothetical protein